MAKRFVTYNTEDAAAGKVPVDSNGTMTGGGGGGQTYDFDLRIVDNVRTLVKGDFATIKAKLSNREPISARIRSNFRENNYT